MLADGSPVSPDGVVDASASVSDKVACIRRHFFQQKEHHRSDHLALDSLLTDYVRLVDDMKGLNNFADTSLALASGCRNDSAHWRSSFEPDEILKELASNVLKIHSNQLWIRSMSLNVFCRLIEEALTADDSKTLLGEPLVQLPIETSPCKLETGLPTADAPPDFMSRPGLKRSAQSLTPPPVQSVVGVDSELSKRPNFDKQQSTIQANSPFRTAGVVVSYFIIVAYCFTLLLIIDSDV
ncbi:hypothetical protein AHF37_03856 [Paragonimus kellicotti]|nr:hypothetical protein AHF37_03856 [Paragonimus kellicotti]